MGFLDYVRRRPSSEPRRVAGEPFELRAAGDGMGGWGQFISPDAITPEVAIRVTAILACVRFIAQGVATMPLRVCRRLPSREVVEAVDLPCYRTLTRRPNSWQSPYEYRETSIYHCALYGNAYSRIVANVAGSGYCDALIPLHPTRVRVHRMTDGTLGYRYIAPDGKPTELRQDDIVHYRWLSDNGYAGMVPSDLCATSLALARKLDQSATSWWDNSARPDVVIETAETVNEDAVRTFRQVWREAYGGPRARGSVAILPKKSTLRTIESNTAEASQLAELRRDIQSEIANVYGVPGSLVGVRDAMKWSTTEQEHLSAQVWCLSPWQQRFEGAIDRCVLGHDDEDRRFRGVFAKLDDVERLRADTETRAKLYDTLAKWGAISPNEMRDAENIPRLEDEAADRTFIQSGFTTIANAADTSMTDGQLAQLVTILGQVTAGTLAPEAAEIVLATCLPNISNEQAAAMVAGAVKEPAGEDFAPVVPPPAPGDESTDSSAEESAEESAQESSVMDPTESDQ